MIPCLDLKIPSTISARGPSEVFPEAGWLLLLTALSVVIIPDSLSLAEMEDSRPAIIPINYTYCCFISLSFSFLGLIGNRLDSLCEEAHFIT